MLSSLSHIKKVTRHVPALLSPSPIKCTQVHLVHLPYSDTGVLAWLETLDWSVYPIHCPDMTVFWYNSLFQFDKTPMTPSPFRQRNTNINAAKVVIPLTRCI